ncbi:hypothetical protein [Deinococcus rufus]|uniref:Uncharacterized protein n=1 Tax=Deinococcus rufus TaxID=2136097 RepID=A0ABV7Z8V4_9DEIO
MTLPLTADEVTTMRASLARFTAPVARLTRTLQRLRLPRAAREATLRHATHALPWSPLAGVEREIREIQTRLQDYDPATEPFTCAQLALALSNACEERRSLIEAQPHPAPVTLPPLPPCPERSLVEDLR